MLKNYNILFSYIFRYRFNLLDLSKVSDLDNTKQEYLEDYPEGLKRVSNITSEDTKKLLEDPKDIGTQEDTHYSIIDLPNIDFCCKEDLEDFVSTNLKINIHRAKGLEKFNQFYRETASLYESRYLRQVPDSVKEYKFKDSTDVFKFLSHTGKGKMGVYKCDLAKLFFSYAKNMNSLRLNSIKDIHSQVEANVFRPVGVKTENVSGSNTIATKFEGTSGDISFHGFNRYKSLGSIVGKEISTIGHNTLDDYTDLHGFTFRCKSKQDLLLLLQQYYGSGVLEGSYIESQGLINKEDVLNCEGLDDSFRQELLTAVENYETNIQKRRKQKGTSQRYKEIRIKGYSKFTNPNDPGSKNHYTGVEIKFELEQNENEYGDSFHPILDYKKRFREITRLSGMIRRNDIINYVNDFFHNLNDNLQAKGKVRDTYLKELADDLCEKGLISRTAPHRLNELELGLYRLFLTDLIPVKKSKVSKKVYYIHKNYEKQELAGIQDQLVRI